jgi:hypothetical protein
VSISGKKYLILSLAAVFMICFAVDGVCFSGQDNRVYLYFIEPGGRYLTAEPRSLEKSEDSQEFCRRVLESLIDGPAGGRSEPLIPVVDPDTRVLGVYIVDGTAYVDLSEKTGAAHFSRSRGVLSELLSVYSIVNTLVLNIDGIDRVQIMISGSEADTFAGHIDVGYPLNAHMLLVR